MKNIVSVPSDRRKDVTYGRIIVTYRLEKEVPYRFRLTVGGDRLTCLWDCSTPTVDMLTVKLLLNSILSTPKAKFMSIKIKDFYLNTPMPRYEYMTLKSSYLPDNVICHYNLRGKVAKDEYIYIEIRRGMYRLPSAGILTQQLLEKQLNKEVYKKSQVTTGFWTHYWRPVSFSLCVDDFGIKYVGKEHADHLMVVLSRSYYISIDWEGERYLGLDLGWDYEKLEMHLSMITYLNDALKSFNHEKPRKPQHHTYLHTKTVYGSKAQFSEPEDMSEILSQANKKFIQEVTGTFLYYAQAVDATTLPALGFIASQQENSTERTMQKSKELLEYATTHPNAIITYRDGDMVLAGHSNASYLSESISRSRAGGHIFMTDEA